MLLINLVLLIKSFDCVSMINQIFMSRPKIIDVNANEPAFYPYSIKVNKCSGSCNNFNDPYANFVIKCQSIQSNVKNQ